MRKVKLKSNHVVRDISIGVILGLILWFVNSTSIISITTDYWLEAIVLAGFVIWVAVELVTKPEKYVNSDGYVVISKTNEFEHRFLAKQKLGRSLDRNEVVHHVNGNKTDNDIRNLCLMNNQKHEFFHSWLRWKKEKTGKYPSISQQKRILEEEYRGTLLENIEQALPTIESHEPNLKSRLFIELKNERTRLAIEKNIPAYMVFNDNTLLDMSEVLPESEEAMLQIRGVGPIKIRMYSSSFLPIILKFRETLNIKPTKTNSETA